MHRFADRSPSDDLEAAATTSGNFATPVADHLTFHIEAATDPRPVFDAIHKAGCTAGLAFNPPTPVSAIEPFIDLFDSILVMSVMPGFGGQKFDSMALDKLRQLRDRPGHRPLLGIDGGIHESTIGEATAAGAELFAVGSAIFYPDSDYGQALTKLTRLAREGLAPEGSTTLISSALEADMYFCGSWKDHGSDSY